MMKYRIKVDGVTPDVEVPEELRNGLECEGFFMSLDRDDIATTVIQGLNTVNMANMIAQNTDVLEAAIIAQGMEKARMMREARKMTMLKGLLDNLADEDEDEEE